MTDPTHDNRRGLLSAEQHERLRGLRRASGFDRHVRALGRGTNLARLVGETPEGLAADLADGRVLAAEGTLALERVPDLTPTTLAWLVRLDDGQTLRLAPAVCLPPGRQRLYFLPRSRWVVHGEARPEQWDEYRALVLRAQHLEPGELDALRAGQLPARQSRALRASVRVWWIAVALAIAVGIAVAIPGTSANVEQFVLALLLGLLGSWGGVRLVRAHRDATRGRVSHVDGPVHVEVTLDRHRANLRLVVAGHRFRLTSAAAGLVPVLHEGTPCRVYRAPTTGLFVAIEPLPGSGHSP